MVAFWTTRTSCAQLSELRLFMGPLATLDALWARARVQLNQGKTRVWNAASEEPPNLSAVSASRLSPACSRPGYSCCSALPLVQTTFSVCFLQTTLLSMLGSMMRRLRPASAWCSTETFPRPCRPQLIRQHTCRSALEGSVCVRHCAACPPSCRSRAAPGELECSACRLATCPCNGKLSRRPGPAGSLPQSTLEGSAAPAPQQA